MAKAVLPPLAPPAAHTKAQGQKTNTAKVTLSCLKFELGLKALAFNVNDVFVEIVINDHSYKTPWCNAHFIFVMSVYL